MKVRLKNKKIIDGKTRTEEFLKILLDNRGVDESFLKNKKVDDLTVEDFGVNKRAFEKALEIIRTAIEKQEKIVIYGDYDADGVTATALLWRAIYAKNKNVVPFVPDREKDGYGINYQSFNKFCKKKRLKADMLITVDNGVVAQKVIGRIKKDGIRVVIVDHHKKNKRKIDVDGLIHSTKTTASVLAFLVARRLGTTDVSLAATGLIADCGDVSISANRDLAIEGIAKMKVSKNAGLVSLMDTAKVKMTNLSEETIGFVIGPRINAAGRMMSATTALRLLCFDDRETILRLAKILEKNNNQRQVAQRKAMEEIGDKEYDQKIIVETGQFHPGIIGLLASRLAEKNNRPAVVVSSINKIYKGSARSTGSFDITSFLRLDKGLFESLGGHAGAAGFSIKKANYAKWQKKITKRFDKLAIKAGKTVEAEAKMKLSALKLANYRMVEKLRPFGIGNSKPLFLFEHLRVFRSRPVGNGQRHLKLKLDDPETDKVETVVADAIAFAKGFLKENIDKSEYVNVLAYLNLNEWMGKKSVELLVKEIWV